MYITLESDYAIRIISILCCSEKRLDAKTISEKASVSLRFTLKILRELVNSGLVVSYKGAKGGYEISRDPKDITLKNVIESIEGTYYFSRCLSDKFGCNRDLSGSCSFQKAFDDISKTVRDKLESYNFADLIQMTDTKRDNNEKETQQK